MFCDQYFMVVATFIFLKYDISTADHLYNLVQFCKKIIQYFIIPMRKKIFFYVS